MSSGNFRKVSERAVFKSSVLDVAIGTFESPDGQLFERDLVHHPGAVVVVPLEETTGEVVLVRQYRAPLDQFLLELPAGKRDVDGEPPEVTAARELTEEAGLAAGEMELIGRFYNSPGFSDEESWCFLARRLAAVPDERQGIEEQHMSVERFALAAISEMIRAGDITDAKTIVGLALAREFLDQAAGNEA